MKKHTIETIKKPYKIFYKCTCGRVVPKIIFMASTMIPPISDTRAFYEVCGECGELTKNWKPFSGRYILTKRTDYIFGFIPRSKIINTEIQERNGKIMR